MAGQCIKVGDNRYRESFGRYYEDFQVGDIYEHRPGRTISEADNTWFTLLTMNTHPMHFNSEFARHSEFGQRIVVSTLTLAIGHERDRREPEGHREPRVDRHPDARARLRR